MVQKISNKPITEVLVENIKEASHWVFAIAPIIASILATLFGSDTHFLEFIFIILAILTNFVILWLRSKTEENKELSLFYTFWTNNLRPNQSGTELLFNTEIAIIEDSEKAYFRERLEKKFQSEPKDGDKRRVPNRDEKLRFRPVLCPQFKIEEVDEDVQKRNIVNLKETLKNDLSSSEAVVIVRTEELEDKSWVYESINEWAYKNSEVPILLVRPRDREKYKRHDLADKFFWIPDEPKTLPWRLLKRAKDRAFAWRVQASYNRAMVTNIFFLSLMFIWIGFFWIQNEKSKYATVSKGMVRAMETKRRYEKEVLKNYNDQLHVSYWFVHNGKPYVFVTTENGDTQNNYDNDKESLIGCGFFEPSKITQWDGNVTVAFNFWKERIEDHGCRYKPRDDEPIGSIVCASYRPSGSSDPEDTVGICVFSTNKDASVLVGNYLEFVKDEVIKFYEDYHPLIKNNKVTPLEDRKKEVH
jgi:hypothetical protein